MTQDSNTKANRPNDKGDIPEFDRKFFTATHDFMIIGRGGIGGKARGLAFIKKILTERLSADDFPGISVSIPRLAVLCSDVFDTFMERNNLFDIALSDDSDQMIARAFLKGDFPSEYVGDLMALVNEVKSPLAIRSSSMLEDAMNQPFAGVYATKMIPNNQSEPSIRFQKLIEAIKFVYASTYFNEAKSYIRGANIDVRNEKMAVIIQEVVGARVDTRFYPTISGVGKSLNFYPLGKSKPEDGVINLALGLGRMIVDGGTSWAYSPNFPKAIPPFGNIRDLLRLTQLKFFAVNMGGAAYDPVKETEFEIECELENAESDNNLKFIASTYNAQSDRLYPGIGPDGPRVVNFAPILSDRLVPLNDVIKKILETSRDAVGSEVEIEFAVTLDKKGGTPARFGFLQVRSMRVSTESVSIDESDLDNKTVIASSSFSLGNGSVKDINNIVFVDPEKFNAQHTRAIALELEVMNRKLINEGVNYLLIGFGRWGSSDPWLGIPVNWGQISGSRAIVEATLPEMNVDLSQGSHFFHNLTGLGVPYFSVRFDRSDSIINWEWLAANNKTEITNFLCRIELEQPLHIKTDGRIGKGVIYID